MKTGETTGLTAVLETLSVDFMIDRRGRLVAARDAGVLPRFVLGRAAEGCVWRFRSDLEERLVVAVGRLAGRERGVEFDGKLPDPPERIGVIERLLAGAGASPTGDRPTPGASRTLVTRSGVTLGEIWRLV